MIFVTGDTHGRIDLLKLLNFEDSRNDLSKDDYMIICGDCGVLWEEGSAEFMLNKYSALPFTILFVDGNHENFDLLERYPIRKWKGGEARFLREDIIQLMRGQVYTIDGATFFTFGGAVSTDRMTRVEGVSWWRQEKPTYEQLDIALANLERVNNTVDYIITHSCDERSLYHPLLRDKLISKGVRFENYLLSNFEERVKYGHWYFGHYHVDCDISLNKTCVYNKIIQLR